MANCYKTKEKEERRQKLYSFLRKNPGKEFSWKQLSPVLNVKYNAISRDMDALADDYKDVVRTSVGIMYNGEIIMEDSVDICERYPVTRNSEGYNDPTAAAALIKEEKAEKKSSVIPKVGDVWYVSKANSKDMDMLYILAIDSEKEFATCCPYCNKSDSIPSDFNRLFTKPLKYFKERCWGMPLSSLIETRNALRDYFEIDPELIEVEKIVEKPVTVNAPAVTTDKLYSQLEMDAAIAKVKAEVYEECFKALARR